MKTLATFLTVLTLGSLPAAEPARLEFTGQVADGATGAPLADVTVTILAAGPRSGNSPLCPFNYPDCGKKASTDAQGHFVLASLDPAMDFCVMALAPGYEPFLNSKLVPEAGPLAVKLRARDLSTAAPERHVFGRLVGPDGAPAVGATVDVEGVEKGEGTQWGGNGTTDAMTISDANGEFHLVGRKDFTAVQCVIRAPGLAERWVRLAPGKAQFVGLRAGGTVQGRLTFRGAPLRGVTLSLATEERQCGKYFNDARTRTDDDGRFAFGNVPPGLKFQLFGAMDAFRPAGAAFQTVLLSPADGASMNLGELTAKPACQIQGRIVLADGKPLPPGTRLMIDRRSAWDTTLVPVDAQGNFQVAGIPPAEQIGVNLQLAGYRFSEKNPNLDLNNRNGLAGEVGGDISGLNVLLEPGKRPGWDELDRASYEEIVQAAQRPLRGAPEP